LGNGLVAASFSGDGSWLSIGAPHPEHGFVELAGAPPFEEAWRADPTAVRRYRDRLTQDRSAFVRLDLPEEDVLGQQAGLDDSGRPTWRRRGVGWTSSTTAWASPNRRTVTQRCILEATPGIRAVIRFGGLLNRCALAEITEVNPPAALDVHNDVDLRGGELLVYAPELATSVRVSVDGPSGGWTHGPDGDLRWEIQADSAGRQEFFLSVSLEPPAWPGEGRPAPAATAARVTKGAAKGVLGQIADGALRYILGCTAMEVGGGERAILTDHRLLPLSWTRDAYYQALLLLRAAPGDNAVAEVVSGHLRWLWGRGRIPGQPWMRSHLPDGRPKDLMVQADQQLYPLLELAAYRHLTGYWPSTPGLAHREPASLWGELVAEVWRDLPRQGEHGLLVGAENPADDPSELPFALSTQILYWYTATQLAPLAKELGLDGLDMAGTAHGIRSAVEQAFACEGPFGPQWAYETDGFGRHRLYQDANDLPTAFAPQWGFCDPQDRLWTTTMRYAFSTYNSGYVAGRYGGLGSAHTPGTWTLGDAQELAVAHATADQARTARVLARISKVAGVDGLLPETYRPDTADWLARHWFAWPAAVLGTLHFDITGC
jgi:hypothetical protein